MAGSMRKPHIQARIAGAMPKAITSASESSSRPNALTVLVLANQTVTISNTGLFTIMATKTGGGPSGTSNSFTVSSGALDHFAVSGPTGGPIGTQTTGAAFSIQIVAEDANNNTVVSFTGTVGAYFDRHALGRLGDNSKLAMNGVLANQSVTISNTGSFTIMATKPGGGPSGTSNSFTVSPRAPVIGERHRGQWHRRGRLQLCHHSHQ